MKTSTKLSFSIATLLAIAFLVACSNNANQTQSSSQLQSQSSEMSSSSMASSSSMSDSSSSTSNSSATQASDLDGTYKGIDHEGDEITLTIKGDTGTWTEVERDGEQDMKQVRLDTTNQQIIIGDDIERYRIEGNALTVEDLDQEINDNDMVTLRKQ